ncbi:MAG: DUF3179 domain-containing protein [Anaerolineae bacterium]|nr:DUF3179 domain-containing protein [Anaerolineae bacterium]
MAKKWLLSVTLLYLLSCLSVPAAAQNSCDDPFGGVDFPFYEDYWPLTDFCHHSVSLDEIRGGGPLPNGIPPIGFPAQPHLQMGELPAPVFESIESAGSWLQAQSPVIALEINGDARVYPLGILIWHEIINDEVGGVPVAVTFCPLCNSGIVFERKLGDDVLFFGTTGNLRKSDMVMWDDRTQSWWQQFTGEAIVGAYTGTILTMLPSHMTAFGQFTAQYPAGQVLSRETGISRDYGLNPYVEYDSGDPFLFPDEIDSRLRPTERVLAGVIGGQPKAYPFTVLSAEIVINDTVGGEDVAAFWQGGSSSALDQKAIDQSRDVGTAALYSRILDGQTLSFNADSNGVIRDDQTGSMWNAFGTAVEGELIGKQLQQILAAPHFWFAWAAFQPETDIYVPESEIV